MPTIALDIETIPNKDMFDKLPEPTVAYGNLKDEEKRKAKYEGAKVKQIATMALYPEYGRICSVVGAQKDKTPIKRYLKQDVSDDKERELIKDVLETFLSMKYNSNIQLVTHNGTSFDLPYIYKRAMILDVPIGSAFPLSYWCKRYTTTPHCDLKMVLGNWGHSGPSLDNAAQTYLRKRKLEIDYSEVPEYIKTGNTRKTIVEANIQHAELTLELYQRCAGYLF